MMLSVWIAMIWDSWIAHSSFKNIKDIRLNTFFIDSVKYTYRFCTIQKRNKKGNMVKTLLHTQTKSKYNTGKFI